MKAIAFAWLTWGAASSLQPADPAATEVTAPQRVVVGVVAGDTPFGDPQLAGILDATFGGTTTKAELATLRATGDLVDRMEWAAGAAAPDVRAVYWIEPVAADHHRLYLLDPRTERIWVRSLPQGSDPTDVLDTLAAMIRSLTDGLPAGEPRGMELVTQPEPTPTIEEPPPKRIVSPPPPPKRRTHVTIAASYVLASFDDVAPVLHGGGVDVDVEVPIGVFARVGIAALQPARIDAPRVDVWRVPIAIEGGYRFRRDRKLRPEVGAALAIDPLLWRGREDAARSGRTARVALGPSVGLTWRLWRGLGAHLWARADVWLHNVSLVVADADGRQARMRPHPVAVLARAGIHWVF